MGRDKFTRKTKHKILRRDERNGEKDGERRKP
jgi:hypothetical protein